MISSHHLLAGTLVIAGDIDPGTAGLVLVYALELTRFLKVCVCVYMCVCVAL